MVITRISSDLTDMEKSHIAKNLAAFRANSLISFSEWTTEEESQRLATGIMLTDEEGLRQDIKSYEKNCIKPLGQVPQALAWYNLRHNVKRRRANAKFYPLRGEPHSYILQNLQEFLISESRPQSPEWIVETGWDGYAKYLRVMGMPGSEDSLVKDFQENFRAPYIADDRRELCGAPRSDINKAVNDYRWMLAHFDQLQDYARNVDREEEVKVASQHARAYLMRGVTERRPITGNTWDGLIITLKEAYLVAKGSEPPANIEKSLRRPSSIRIVQTLAWNENGDLVSTGVEKVKMYNY